MSSERSRAAEALQRIYFSARSGDEAKPVDYVEAISIAKEHEVEQATQTAIDALAGTKAVVAEARAIIKAFFGELPHVDAADDEPERPGMGCAIPDGHDGPTPAPVMGRTDEAEADNRPAPVPQRDDGKRTVAEIEAAADVIIGATLRRRPMAEAALEAMKAVRKLAARLVGRSKSASSVLDHKATELKKASAAAGTQSYFDGAFAPIHPEPDSEQALIDAAIQRGASTEEINQIERLSGDFGDLRARGQLRNQSRAAFIAMNIKFEADRTAGKPY